MYTHNTKDEQNDREPDGAQGSSFSYSDAVGAGGSVTDWNEDCPRGCCGHDWYASREADIMGENGAEWRAARCGGGDAGAGG